MITVRVINSKVQLSYTFMPLLNVPFYCEPHDGRIQHWVSDM